MSSRLLTRRTFFTAAAIALIIAGLALQLDIRTNPRPVGGVDEIASLAARNDLNLLFVLIDTLLRDHLGVYGYERPISPTLDRLARAGLFLSNQEASSSHTVPSTLSLLPSQHGLPWPCNGCHPPVARSAALQRVPPTRRTLCC